MKNCKYFKAKGIDYKGQLQKIQKSNNKLQPLYEALTNSIEAIKLLEDKNKKGLSLYENKCYKILGLPFYNFEMEDEFKKEFQELL